MWRVFCQCNVGEIQKIQEYEKVPIGWVVDIVASFVAVVGGVWDFECGTGGGAAGVG